VLQDALDRHAGTHCYVAEKLDGSSVTYYLKDGEFGVCSRNLELLEDADNSLWKVARTSAIEEKLRSLGENVALQGEMIGEGIQGNLYRLKGQQVHFFNLFFIDRFAYADFDVLEATLHRLDLQMVPVLDRDFVLPNDIPALLQMATGTSTLYKVEREGLVIRPLQEQRDQIGRVSFKAISAEFLLKHDH
jgi:RNA ligase (TIGR02306 family)